MYNKLLTRITGAAVSAAIVMSAAAVSVSFTSAADNDFAVTVDIANVTTRYSETGDLLDLVNEFRSSKGADDLVFDRADSSECIGRAAELPVSFTTADLLRQDYNYKSDEYTEYYSEAKTYEVVFSYNGTLSSLSGLTAGQNPYYNDYKKILEDPDLTEITIGVVSVNNESKRYVCMRLTNYKSLVGARVRSWSSDDLRAKSDVTEKKEVNAYLSELNLDTTSLDNTVMAVGETKSACLKAKSKTANTYVNIVPHLSVGSTSVLSIDYNNAVLTAKAPGKTTVTCSLTGMTTGTGNKTYTYNFTVTGKDLSTLTTDTVSSQKYTGSAITPKPKIYAANGTALTEGKDFQYSYIDNINPGNASIVFTGLNDYAGTKKTISFTIVGTTNPGNQTVKGDINGDKEANVADALMAARYDAGLITLTDAQKKAGDVTGDNEVDVADALMIARFDAGLISSL